MKIFFLSVLWYLACKDYTKTYKPEMSIDSFVDTPIVKIKKPNDVWKKELNAMEYNVLREKGTERAFSGDLWDNHDKGVYICRACKLPLFDSDTKFESGTGWPSFYKPINKKNVVEISDMTHGMVRTEVVCGRCDGHLGHVFDDGPKPTGLRYCMNSVSMDFVKK
jgi:peptide-methionine (R)-S-oxide reductase